MKILISFFSLSLILISCQDSLEPYATASNDTASVKVKKPLRYFSGKPALPVHDLHITTSGIGKYILGKNIDSLKKSYDSLQTILVYREGVEWPGIKIFFPDQKWLIGEAVNTVESITCLRTNNPSFKTEKGYHAGMKVDSVLKNDSVQVHSSHQAFEFGNSDIYFKIDPVKEKKFFRKNSFNFNILKGAHIEEIFIICGDC